MCGALELKNCLTNRESVYNNIDIENFIETTVEWEE